MRLGKLFRGNYHSLNTIEISQTAFIHNYHYLSSLSSARVAPVLKSNAYGHGLQLVAKILDPLRAPFFCVDSLYEAYELQKINIKTPVLLMGYTNPLNFKMKKLPFSFAVYDKETLAVLSEYQRNVRIHVFVDTGMNREGIKISELLEFLRYSKKLKNIHVEGLMSHFAVSDQYKNPLTIEQVKNFHLAQEMFHKEKIFPKYIHIGNSAACLLSKQYKGKIGNMIRVGIATYGLGGEIDDKNLQPVTRVITTLGQVKLLRKDEKVGYDFTYTAKTNMKIGILPYGYYDGLDRRLSNKGFVLIDNVSCPIVGRVSMNITAVDISRVRNPYVGQRVIIYSDDPSDKNSLHNVALLTGTIQRDLLVHLAESTKRIII